MDRQDDQHVLPDVLAPGLLAVFCGSAVGTASARRGAYYAGPGNKFWPILHRLGLTDRRLDPQEYELLPRYGFGLTDIVKATHGADSSLRPSDFDAEGLRDRILRHAPAFLAFNGKKAAERYLRSWPVSYGEQPERIGDTRLVVLPSTSGAANGHWDESWWRRFAGLALSARGGPNEVGGPSRSA